MIENKVTPAKRYKNIFKILNKELPMKPSKKELTHLLLNTFKTDSEIYIYTIENIIKNILSKLKNEKKLNFKTIANKLGVSQRLIYHYQKGTRPISIKNLFILLDLLDETTEKLDFSKRNCLILASSSGSRNKLCKIPLQFSSDLFYVAGYLFGDGCLHTNKWTLSFVDEYKNHIEKISNLIKHIFEINTTITIEKGKTELATYSKVLFIFFKTIFEMPVGVKKNQLHIPTILGKFPKRNQLAFLSGLFDADAGTLRIEEYLSIPKWFLKSPNIEFVQADCNFVYEIKELCTKLGLKPTGPYFNPANKGYRLFLCGRNTLQQCKNISLFRHPIKQKRLSLICTYFKLEGGIAPPNSSSLKN